jgi:hypothetical protein
MHSIRLSADERNTLLGHYRRHSDTQVRQRAHILLLLAQGYAWAAVAAVLFCSPDTIARWKRRFEQGGVAAVLSPAPWPPAFAGLGLGRHRGAVGTDPAARRVRLRPQPLVL